MKNLKSGNIGLACLATVVVLSFPLLVTQPTYQNFAILVLMAAQLGVAWNILGGYAGQVSLGHAVFFGIGAYTSSMLVTHAGLSPWFGMLAGGVVTSLFALAIGWPCFRLKGHYFAMATIAVAEIMQVVISNWDYLEGAIGIYLPMAPSGFKAFVFTSKIPYYYIALGLLLFSLLVNLAIERSHVGYYLRAIKDEPEAARSLGVSLTRYKLVAIAASSFLTAMGGTLYAQKELFIDPPSMLSTQLSIKIALIAILGGVGTLFGPVVGAIVLITIEEMSRIYFGSSGQGTDMIIYGAIIIVVAVYSPSGLIGLWRQAKGALPFWRAAAPQAKVGEPS
ncbi:branched-chain amino acid ABC transporter permease [Telmatospirillum sp.]|uniref:branched-chain amino acid ABC transporter permease n=1 Tax=Telmatospirillum sp. TaxID=2079197 RepID=UPI00284AAC7A|nr:branched-chain amino acid ABC transporter permease [Telmatospirillum sp.]MDR3438012.1 branched-chain amino acid ABC transporter permease [Telmatospirillum sp.]